MTLKRRLKQLEVGQAQEESESGASPYVLAIIGEISPDELDPESRRWYDEFISLKNDPLNAFDPIEARIQAVEAMAEAT